MEHSQIALIVSGFKCFNNSFFCALVEKCNAINIGRLFLMFLDMLTVRYHIVKLLVILFLFQNVYMLRICQIVALHSKPFFSVWFQIKHQVGMRKWCCIFVGPRKEFHLTERICLAIVAKCELSRGFLKIIMWQELRLSKNPLTFMEQILCKIDHGKIVITATCKQLSSLRQIADELFECV